MRTIKKDKMVFKVTPGEVYKKVTEVRTYEGVIPPEIERKKVTASKTYAAKVIRPESVEVKDGRIKIRKSCNILGRLGLVVEALKGVKASKGLPQRMIDQAKEAAETFKEHKKAYRGIIKKTCKEEIIRESICKVTPYGLEEMVDLEKNPELKSSLEKPNLLHRIVDGYFRPKPVEKWNDGKLYRLLLVDQFKKIMPISDDYPSKLRGLEDDKELKKYEFHTKIFETAHTLLGIIFIPSIVYGFAQGDYERGIGGVILGLIIGAYPAMAHRYNRAKAYNTVEQNK